MFGDIETPPLTEIGTFIQQLAGAGAPLFPDDDLENHLRGMASLPERRESAKGDMGGTPPATSGPADQLPTSPPPPTPKPEEAPTAENGG